MIGFPEIDNGFHTKLGEMLETFFSGLATAEYAGIHFVKVSNLIGGAGQNRQRGNHEADDGTREGIHEVLRFFLDFRKNVIAMDAPPPQIVTCDPLARTL